MLEKDLQILRVSRHADMEEVRKAFVKLSRRYHPEHFPEKFKQIKAAYDRLSFNWSAIKPYIEELSGLNTPEEFADFLHNDFMEALEQPSSAQSRGGDSGFDIFSLEPVLNVSSCREKISELLKDIHDRGVEYHHPEHK